MIAAPVLLHWDARVEPSMPHPSPHRFEIACRPLRAAALLLCAAALAAGQAVAADKNKDPFEHVNRATYAFNDALDRMIARPAAKAYQKVVPTFARRAVSNFLENLDYPKVIVNDALQGKFKDAGSDTARLAVNTVVGVGGLFDPATKWGLISHENGFGQTLGHWGVPPGPFIEIPLLGPSDMRDAPSKLLVDHYMSPETYASTAKLQYGIVGLGLLDRRVELLSTDAAVRQAFDPYAFIRDAYLARRYYLVHDGVLPEESYDEPLEAPGDAPPAAAPDKDGAAPPH